MDDLDRFDLNSLRALAHLLETRSVTEAATRAGISQPAMSRTLARLREFFGDALLVQVGRGSELSERGRDLRPRLAEALSAVRDALRAAPAFDPSSARFELRIAANDYAASALLLPWLADVREAAPGACVRIEPVGFHSIAQLAQGELDFAVAPRIHAPSSGLDRFVVRELWRDDFRCVMRRGHPAARRRFDLGAFLRHEHVVVATGTPGPATVDAALAKLGHARITAAVVPSFALVPQLLAGSDLIATLPRRFVASACAGLAVRNAPLALPDLTLYLGWHPRSTADGRHRWARESLLAHAGHAKARPK